MLIMLYTGKLWGGDQDHTYTKKSHRLGIPHVVFYFCTWENWGFGWVYFCYC